MFGIIRSQDELTDDVSVDVAKDFDIVWVEGLYKLAILNFPSYVVKTLSSYFHCTFQTPFKSSHMHTSYHAGVAGRNVSTVLFSLYVNDIPTP
jgi:hypothetical protein